MRYISYRVRLSIDFRGMKGCERRKGPPNMNIDFNPNPGENQEEHEALRRFFELYREGRFYECHDVLEALWLDMGARRRTFYQGLLQCAVARHHAEKGNLHGARILHRDGTAKLELYRPEFMGVDLEGFLKDLKDHLPEISA
ncbi:MAG: DUF309 domain-containing protein [Candidatus Omnitrophica bacterium]|nr:DUF309 domain-containing protein [Candidatus Omnitrophota bacterium]